ncbi:MAG: transcription-repair coupling factor [Bacteroidaceae bacterium]
MELLELHRLYAKHPQVVALQCLLKDNSIRTIFVDGLRASASPMLFACLQTQEPKVFMLGDEEEAGYFYHDLVQTCGEASVLFFPSSYRRQIKYAQRDAANEILRVEALRRLHEDSKGLMLVTYPAAMAEKVVSQQCMSDQMMHLKVGELYDLPHLEHELKKIGFRRTDYVYEPGEYAVRGSILDVFSFSSEYPFRIDFFGDEVDTIRSFEVENQLSRSKHDAVTIVPEMEQIETERVSFFHFLPEQTLFVARDIAFVTDSIEHIYKDGFSKQAVYEQAAESILDENENNTKLCEELLLIDGPSFLRSVLSFRRIEIGHKPTGIPQAKIGFHTSSQPIYHKNFELVQQSFLDYQQRGYTLYILADSSKQHERLQAIFKDMRGGVTFTPIQSTLHTGFADDDLRFCFFTDHQIFDRFHKYNLRSERARGGKVALTLKEIKQFEPGDFVVHIDHGVGKFMGLVRVPSGDTMQEVMKLVFKGDDVVFVSIHSLHKVSKYKGKDGEPPVLTRLGTGSWEKLKERTKNKIKDIARDLIRLYSRRKEEKGFVFSSDNFMQHELEASFVYEDTPDQLKVTQEIKSDMERDRPMDRLVCGDVGFGKTEIAVRAAFKAACDNKQVAVLVPTTVLAYQHYKTFSERLKAFPVRVDYLSRARTTKQTSEVLRELKEGQINIIIGTHKLIGKNVQFHDLGLLIIDEEQKFGVSTKEKLRQIKINVDTLTMTATPIPRTLQFSLMGARDLSVIQTPPPNRYPIQTEIHLFQPEIIADAVNFEMSRNGQVFIVSHRISSLPHIESVIRKYVPDARVAIGHGQMSPEKLEQIIFDFVNHDVDVLISTTIVENGIDIPNANTIIIDNAHHFGLSDLHQMRGRVGRGNKKAFCYLLAPPLASLPTESRRRLQAIENFCDLGSGIHIAMQDLDIRGAGNMLGAEQSGFIADLGYETYQKILAEAISELKNEEFADLYAQEIEKNKEVTGSLFVDECTLDSDLQIFFPETYIPGSSERMLLYRELDELSTDEELNAYRKRLEDRFGKVPEEGEDLMRVVQLRRIGRYLGIERIILKRGRMILYFISNDESAYFKSDIFGSVLRFATQMYQRCKMEEEPRRRISISNVRTITEALNLLQSI